MSVNWRTLGDTTLETYRSEFARFNSPMLPFVEEIYEAAKPHSALILAKMYHEGKYETLHDIPLDYHNPCSLAKPNGSPLDGVNRWERYRTFAEGVRACVERITSPTYKPSDPGVYARTVTLADLIRKFAPPSENDTNLYIDTVQTLLNKWPREGNQEQPPVADIVFEGMRYREHDPPVICTAHKGAVVRAFPSTKARQINQFIRRTKVNLFVTVELDGERLPSWYQIVSTGRSNLGFIHTSGIDWDAT